jgi:hypothetical protein
MFITVEGFGSIWSKRVRPRLAYYNTTGIETNGRLRHRSRVFGQLRFNQAGGFNSRTLERNLGHVFECTGTPLHDGMTVLLHHRTNGPVVPEYFLVGVTSKRTGFLQIETEWRSQGVLLVSLSQFDRYQEALLLMTAYSWIQGDLGRFVAEPFANASWRSFLRLT